MRTRTTRLRREKRSSSPRKRVVIPMSDVLDASDPLVLLIEDLRYEFEEAPSLEGGKVVLRVSRAEQDGPSFTDRLDPYAFRSRLAFATVAAETFGRTTETVLGQMAVLLDQVERASLQEKKPSTVVLSAERKAAAEKVLRVPDILERAAQAIEQLGYVGEDRNKRLVYLVATSRLLGKPLSAILFAPSGTGKSELLDRVAQLMPPEQVEFLSRLTPHALYYAGADHLRHKLVIVDEQAGAAESDYAIRTLQSKGFLRLAVAVKGRTENFEARGPIALLSGTTRDDLNPENLSRCLELSLDDSAEQTQRVQEAQRRAWAGKASGTFDVEPWQDAQRLLEPHEVVIPFAERLTYPARTSKDRRDNMKLLTLVASHALLNQRQRDFGEDGRIVATVQDYEVVFELLRPLVDDELDGLSPRAAQLYRDLVEEGIGEGITRREVAARFGWPYMTATRALAELVAQELLTLHASKQPRRYQLLDASMKTTARLTPPEKLAE
jgi:hypothetical protein